MRRPRTRTPAALLAALAALAGGLACRAAPAPPAPVAGPVAGPVPVATTPAPPAARPAPTGHDGDARFLQHMMAHHAQALAMAALVDARTTRGDLRLLAERIAVSQRDELALMRRWLERHGRPVPDVSALATPDTAPPAGAGHAGHAGHDAAGRATAEHGDMPGMLAPEEMRRLAAARGPAFDRLFLESMIRHHEGALVMVADLLGTPGAAQQSEIYHIAAEVDADQRAEIQRMRALLARLPAAPPPG